MNPLNKWLKAIHPSIPYLNSDDVQAITAFVVDALALAYHHITKLRTHRSTQDEKTFSKTGSPDHPPVRKWMTEVMAEFTALHSDTTHSVHTSSHGLKIAHLQRKTILLSEDLKEWNRTRVIQLLEAAT